MGSSDTWLLDAGNSQLKFAVLRGGEISHQWQIPSDQAHLAQQSLDGLLKLSGSDQPPRQVVYSSVIPKGLQPLLALFEKSHICRTEVTQKMLESHGFRCDASGVGVDRLVAGFSAWGKYRQDLIVVDLGTATTFDLVTKKGCFLGGAIFPGLNLCKQALTRHAEALKDVKLNYPNDIIGKNSTEAIQSGILFGYTSLVETMLVKFAASHGAALLSIATGGLAPIIYRQTKNLEAFEPNLTLDGLAYIARLEA